MKDDAGKIKIVPGLNDAESVRAMRKRQAALGMQMQRIGAVALAELEKKAKAGALDAEDAETLTRTGIEMECAAIGEKEPDGAKKPH